MDIPLELVEDFERGDVVLFVGDAVCGEASSSLTSSLLAKLIERTGWNTTEFQSFPQIAQAYQDNFGRYELFHFLRQHAEANAQPCRVHQLIATLPHCHTILTTCIDDRLEAAFRDVKRRYTEVLDNRGVPFMRSDRLSLSSTGATCTMSAVGNNNVSPGR